MISKQRRLPSVAREALDRLGSGGTCVVKTVTKRVRWDCIGFDWRYLSTVSIYLSIFRDSCGVMKRDRGTREVGGDSGGTGPTRSRILISIRVAKSVKRVVFSER